VSPFSLFNLPVKIKYNVKKLISTAAVLSFCFILSAQQSPGKKDDKKAERREKINALKKQAEEGTLVYRSQSIFGAQLRTNGYGLFYELGKMKTTRRSNIYRIDITEIKNQKEEKQPAGGVIFGNPYIYGKLNNFYQVTIGFGQQYILGQKGNKNGVAVSMLYNGGLAIGLQRPYYLEIQDPSSGENRFIKYEDDNSLFLDKAIIVGGAGLGKGWGEMTVSPGLFGKFAIRFDYGRFNEVVSGLELGLSADYYTKKAAILHLQKEKQLFYQAYLAVLFGRRK
jgi:hypothetical protein